MAYQGHVAGHVRAPGSATPIGTVWPVMGQSGPVVTRPMTPEERERYGSVAETPQAPGFRIPRGGVQTTLSPETEERIRQMISQGAGSAAIHRQTRVSYNAIYKRVRRLGLDRYDSEAGAWMPKGVKSMDELRERIEARVRSGEAPDEIAAVLLIEPSVVETEAGRMRLAWREGEWQVVDGQERTESTEAGWARPEGPQGAEGKATTRPVDDPEPTRKYAFQRGFAAGYQEGHEHATAAPEPLREHVITLSYVDRAAMLDDYVRLATMPKTREAEHAIPLEIEGLMRDLQAALREALVS